MTELLISTEAAWGLWFSCLPIWDKRTVLKHELEWYDKFIAGEWTMADLRIEIEKAQGITPFAEAR